MDPINAKKIKNIIFDLGGVIMNLDVQKTIKEFYDLGITDVVNKTGHHYKDPIFYNFEIGNVSDIEFIERIHKLSKSDVSHDKIRLAWNAMILDMPKERIDFILNLKKEYSIFLLSNTNSIHKDKFELAFKKQHDFPFTEMFEKVYYSHEVGLRKPGEEIFRYVLEDSKLDPEETLFIDDSIQNINAAHKIGIKTFHIHDGNYLKDLFDQN